MKSYLASGPIREEILAGMELEALVLWFIRDPNTKKIDDLTEMIKEYHELWWNNHG